MIKFITPTAIPFDEDQRELLKSDHLFFWQFQHDTLIPAGTRFREELHFDQDSVLITQYAANLPMPFYARRNNIPFQESNEKYTVNQFKLPYTMRYEIATIRDPQSKKLIDFEFLRGNGLLPFEQLKNTKTKRIYENEAFLTVGSEESEIIPQPGMVMPR